MVSTVHPQPGPVLSKEGVTTLDTPQTIRNLVEDGVQSAAKQEPDERLQTITHFVVAFGTVSSRVDTIYWINWHQTHNAETFRHD